MLSAAGPGGPDGKLCFLIGKAARFTSQNRTVCRIPTNGVSLVGLSVCQAVEVGERPLLGGSSPATRLPF